MSCDVAAAVIMNYAAWVGSGPSASELTRAAFVRVVDAPSAPLAREPLFGSIVRDAGRLRAQVDRLKAGAADAETLASVRPAVAALSALDMQGHLELARRGTDGDLKCILRGISQDLPRKLDQVLAAADAPARRAALEELSYLLRDNVEVITTPPAQTSTDVAKPG